MIYQINCSLLYTELLKKGISLDLEGMTKKSKEKLIDIDNERKLLIMNQLSEQKENSEINNEFNNSEKSEDNPNSDE